jgi:hypothetical protein
MNAATGRAMLVPAVTVARTSFRQTGEDGATIR